MKAGTAAVWEAFAGRLRGFFRRRVASTEMAEDLLQETFLRIHKGLGAVRDETRLSGWVFQVARNVLRDHYGRRKTGEPLPALEGDDKELNLQVASWLGVFVQGRQRAHNPVVFNRNRRLAGTPLAGSKTVVELPQMASNHLPSSRHGDVLPTRCLVTGNMTKHKYFSSVEHRQPARSMSELCFNGTLFDIQKTAI